MKIYTIGFTKKAARAFFELLKKHQIRQIVDIRLNNVSQLAGFSKGDDLKFFLSEICNIIYLHNVDMAPNKKLLDDYKNKKISWQQYETLFNSLLIERNVKDKLERQFKKNFEGICLLCSEATADKCHRRLVAEYIKRSFPEADIQIIHI